MRWFFVLLLLITSPALALTIQDVSVKDGPSAWLVERHDLPVISLDLVFTRAGGAYVTPDKLGMTNLLAEMLDKGAGKYSRQEFQDLLYAHAIELSFSDETDTFAVRLRTLKEHLPLALDLLTAALADPHFEPADIAQAREELLADLRFKRQDPGYNAQMKWRQLYFGEHPYGRNFDGSPETLSAITSDDLRGFLLTHFSPDRLYAGIVGDITPAQSRALLQKIAGALKVGAAPAPLPAITAAFQSGDYFMEENVPQSAIIFGQPYVPRQDPKFFEASLLNTILGAAGGQPSRLYKEVRESRGLVYSVSSNIVLYESMGILAGSAATRTTTAEEAKTVIKDVFQRLAEQGPTETELEEAKKYVKGSFALSLSDTADIARVLTMLQYYHLGIDYIDQREKMIDNVTLASMQEFTKTHLTPQHLLFVTAGRVPEKKQ